MSQAIEVTNIKRIFRSSQKTGTGIKDSLKFFFKPEFKEHQALKGVSFSVEEGAFIGLIGENGAGKTTLLKILSGLIPPTSGTARVLGYTPFDRKVEFRKKISLVMGQKAQLWWDLPAVDAFDLIRAIYKIPVATYKKRLSDLTTLLSVEKLLNTQIRRLSLGERMKMELIGAILHWPKVLYLDEPTIGLDVLAAHRLREFLKTFNERENTTIILTSHNMEDIERLCSRVILLRAGEMVFDGKPSGLTQSEQVQLRIRLQSESSIQAISAHLKKPESTVKFDEEETAYLVEIHRTEVVNTLQSLMTKFGVVDMRVEEATLESVIQRLYERDRS